MLVITLLIILFVAFPIQLLFTGGKILRLPDGLFSKHKFTAFFHGASIVGAVLLGGALNSLELIAIGLYITAAFNTFVLKLFSHGEHPPVYLYNIYLVAFWASIFWLPSNLGVKAPFL